MQIRRMLAAQLLHACGELVGQLRIQLKWLSVATLTSNLSVLALVRASAMLPAFSATVHMGAFRSRPS